MLKELFLDTRNELKLFLVKNNIFSATNISLKSDDNFLYTEKIYDIKTNKTLIKKEANTAFVSKFYDFLEENNFYYSKPYNNFKINSLKEKYEINKDLCLYISNNSHLIFLLEQNISLEQRLQIMGWPEDDAVAFSNKDQSIYRDFSNKFKEAHSTGILSSSLAYLTFIPEKFDWVNDDYKLKTITHCLNIQRFVRTNNPYLAKRVEKEFIDVFSGTKSYDSDNFISFFGLNSN